MKPALRLEVLVVDDDPAIRDSLRRVLEHAGHTVTEAESGERALAILDGQRVDAVLLDIAMPGINGLEALVRIREMAPDTGVIVVTGEGTVANALKAGQRGAYDFIEKPPDRERLLDVLAEAAQVTRLRRTAEANSREILLIELQCIGERQEREGISRGARPQASRGDLQRRRRRAVSLEGLSPERCRDSNLGDRRHRQWNASLVH